MLLCLSFYLNMISLCYYHKLVLGNISHNQISTSNITFTFRHGRLVEVGVNNGVVLLLGPLALLLLLILALLQLHHQHRHGHALGGADDDDGGDAVVTGAIKVHLLDMEQSHKAMAEA